MVSSSSFATPLVTCNELQSGTIYPDGRTANFFKISFAKDIDVKEGVVTGFNIQDQNGKTVPNVASTITANFTKVAFFYEVRVNLPVGRGQTPRDEIQRVYAVQAHLKSTNYELDWKSGGDYRYLVKEMTRNLFCTTSEIVKKESK